MMKYSATSVLGSTWVWTMVSLCATFTITENLTDLCTSFSLSIKYTLHLASERSKWKLCLVYNKAMPVTQKTLSYSYLHPHCRTCPHSASGSMFYLPLLLLSIPGKAFYYLTRSPCVHSHFYHHLCCTHLRLWQVPPISYPNQPWQYLSCLQCFSKAQFKKLTSRSISLSFSFTTTQDSVDNPFTKNQLHLLIPTRTHFGCFAFHPKSIKYSIFYMECSSVLLNTISQHSLHKLSVPRNPRLFQFSFQNLDL